MHFHLPKPLHGWREFAGEVGIIVIGVLIALGAEQAVEFAHWRGEVDDARNALQTELDHDLGAVAFRQAQDTCVTRRMDAVDAWLASLRTEHPLAMTGRISGPAIYTIHSSVWEIVKTGQAAAHMGLADKIAYAQIYDVLQNISNVQERERQEWHVLAEADGARSLTDAELRSNRLATKLIRDSSTYYANNLDEISGSIARLHLRPDTLKNYYPERSRRFCASILPTG